MSTAEPGLFTHFGLLEFQAESDRRYKHRERQFKCHTCKRYVWLQWPAHVAWHAATCQPAHREEKP